MFPPMTERARPAMLLYVALHPSEPPFGVQVCKLSTASKLSIQGPRAGATLRAYLKLTEAASAFPAPYAGFLLLLGGWLTTAESLTWADHDW
jgi:hypothetical protein